MLELMGGVSASRSAELLSQVLDHSILGQQHAAGDAPEPERERAAVGSRVEVHGLLQQAALNGRQGVVLGWDEGRARHRVRLDGSSSEPSEVKSIKPPNLRDCGEAVEAATVHFGGAAHAKGGRRGGGGGSKKGRKGSKKK